MSEPLTKEESTRLTGRLKESLRKAITKSGKSQGELARAIGVTQPAISQFMSDKASMRLEMLAPLMHVLGIEIKAKRSKPKASA